MKKGVRLTAIILIAFSLALAFSGCFNRGGGKEDKTKTQLYIGHYDGGYGTKWLDSLIKRFEELYKDKSFEKDKKGVQIWVDNNKDTMSTTKLQDSMAASSTLDIYFPTGSNVDYLVDQGYLLDLTSIVKENMLEKFGEDATIESKIADELKDFLQRDGKYYSLPHNSSTLGVIYDVDLFNQRKLFLQKGGAPSENLQSELAYPQGGELDSFNYKWTDLAGNKSAGPDGQYYTHDDGLPATYDEFFKLCDRMVSLGITPLSWTGQYSYNYTLFLARSLWADYEGPEKARVSFTSGGVAGENNVIDVINSFDSNGNPVIGQETVNGVSDYAKVAKQPGIYYGLKFWEKIVQESYYSQLSINISQSHVMAQWEYLESSLKKEPIAMLLEGSWWENEAEDAKIFDDLAAVYGSKAARENRRFAFLPLPKALPEKIGEVAAYNNAGDPLYSTMLKGLNMCFISSKIPEYKKQLALDFLQFTATDQSLSEFVLDTGVTRNYNYEIKEDVYNKLSYYSRSLVDNVQSAASLTRMIPNPQLQKALSEKELALYSCYSKVNNQQKNIFLNALRIDKISAQNIFEGIYNYQKDYN